MPPVERARRAAEKQSFYVRLSSPLVRTVLLKGALKPLSQPSVSPMPADTLLAQFFSPRLASFPA